MSQINLLKQSGQESNLKRFSPKIIAEILLGVLLLIGVYYCYLFFRVKSVEGKIAKTQVEIENINKQALGVKGREELFTRQQQIKTLSGLVEGQEYWSKFFPALAKVTLKTASYISLRAGPDTTVTMAVTVPKLEDVDKYLQVFNLDDFNKNFSNVRIGGYNKVQSELPGGALSSTYEFRILMDFDPSIIKYK